ncbi:PspA/IM30 family protein [Kordiimonas gwangyangensis]|uniref:PspA/IM30 family protein n=2 Tax=Kordiimonas gwangyangensis TaxID=288022 RepID=UPI000362DB1A|nr:PspA/IM30 family protein [Kordiimonas gwangyangensis]
MSNIASRVSRLIAGSVNAALDAVENMSPEMVMEQAIREVEGAIAEVRAEMGKATAERHLASKKLADNSGKHEELLEQIEVAVSKGRDDLASAAISRQMDLEAQVPVLEQTIADAAEREKELEGYVDALKGKRAEMLEELKAYRARIAEMPENSVIDAAGNPSASHEINKSVDRAAAAFDRASGHAADMLGGGMKDAAQMAELKDLARQSEIEKRLKAMKEKSA